MRILGSRLFSGVVVPVEKARRVQKLGATAVVVGGDMDKPDALLDMISRNVLMTHFHLFCCVNIPCPPHRRDRRVADQREEAGVLCTKHLSHTTAPVPDCLQFATVPTCKSDVTQPHPQSQSSAPSDSNAQHGVLVRTSGREDAPPPVPVRSASRFSVVKTTQ